VRDRALPGTCQVVPVLVIDVKMESIEGIEGSEAVRDFLQRSCIRITLSTASPSLQSLDPANQDSSACVFSVWHLNEQKLRSDVLYPENIEVSSCQSCVMQIKMIPIT
jgi:hypothetical protein